MAEVSFKNRKLYIARVTWAGPWSRPFYVYLSIIKKWLGERPVGLNCNNWHLRLAMCYVIWTKGHLAVGLSHANKNGQNCSVSGIRLALQQFCWLDTFLTRSLGPRWMEWKTKLGEGNLQSPVRITCNMYTWFCCRPCVSNLQTNLWAFEMIDSTPLTSD